MQARVDDLRSRLPGDAAAVEVVKAAQTEIDYFRRYSGTYFYAFFIVQPFD